MVFAVLLLLLHKRLFVSLKKINSTSRNPLGRLNRIAGFGSPLVSAIQIYSCIKIKIQRVVPYLSCCLPRVWVWCASWGIHQTHRLDNNFHKDIRSLFISNQQSFYFSFYALFYTISDVPDWRSSIKYWILIFIWVVSEVAILWPIVPWWWQNWFHF